MKTRISHIKNYISILAITIACGGYAQEITGDWYGALELPGMKMRLVFHIIKNSDGLSSTMDSPDQKAYGIKITSTKFTHPDLSIESTEMGMKYNGKLTDGKIAGSFQQAGQTFPLDLSRQPIEEQRPARPQEPKAPYGYYTEEITFSNEKGEFNLAGTLSMPSKDGKFPAIILISGSGPQNRDEELLGHKPFLVIADYFTKKGFAVLRYDDRGVGHSGGTYKNATSADFAGDALAAFTYLQSRPEIDKNKIGIMGHSEGGMIAPMIAAQNRQVAFLVLLAAPGLNGGEILLLQQELIGRAAGVSGEYLNKTKEVNRGAFEIVWKNRDREKMKEELSAYLKKIISETPASEKPIGQTDDEILKRQMAVIADPWMTYFISYEPSASLQKVTCPVLCLNGEKDLQVPPKVNLAAIQESLSAAGNAKVRVKEMPGLNHLFQECTTGSPDEYRTIEQTFSPKALKEIEDWLAVWIK